jgi:hypothetical protein
MLISETMKFRPLLPFKAQWLLYVPPALTHQNSAFCSIKSVCFPKQCRPVGLSRGDVKCFLWGTSWYIIYREIQNMVMNIAGLGPEKDCAVESQQQLWMTNPSSLTRGHPKSTNSQLPDGNKSLVWGPHMGTWHQDRLDDWSSVATWLSLRFSDPASESKALFSDSDCSSFQLHYGV